MTDDGIKVTPLAGRVAFRKKEAITGSVFVVILMNIIILVLVQVALVFLAARFAALFWIIVALLIVADAALSVFCFRRALSEVRENNAAPPYAVAYRHDGLIMLCHGNAKKEYLPADAVIEVKACPAKVGFVLSGWAYSGSPNYGKIVFILSGEKPQKKKVKYVANCVQSAEFIRDVFLKSRGDAINRR